MSIVKSTRNFFYAKKTVTQEGSFLSSADYIFPFTPTKIIISRSKGNKSLFFSFNGVDVDGELFKSDGPISFEGNPQAKIFFHRESGGGANKDLDNVRIWAWRL